MRTYRIPVLAAWIFCVGVSAVSVYSAIGSLIQIPSSDQKLLQAGSALWSLLPVLFAIPAALIISHQPRNVIGWLLMVLPVVGVPVGMIDAYLVTFPTAPEPTIPLLVMMTISSLSWMAFIFPILLIPLFFPTGRLLSPRWRWVVTLTAGMVLFLTIFSIFSREYLSEGVPWRLTNPYGVLPRELDRYILPPWVLLLLVLLISSLTSIAVRYRRAGTIEREQMKWQIYAYVIFGVIYFFSVIRNFNASTWSNGAVINLLFVVGIGGIPIAITMAILRYHLFDIDVIIRLTLVYATVTALLGLVFAGGVALLQEAARSLTGQTSELAVLVTTLAIASLFNPLRQRVQEIINRRFYRQTYNAEQAFSEFASAARSGSDLDALTGMLTELVSKTLEPAQVSLYMRARANEGGSALREDAAGRGPG